ncbi:MAG TPA: 4'-phosphopantetheinyl transferase superfamily protein [Dysgonamonadaceae bacterium]|nr:4'-phosphopantetheinyl transferase superfamily protein [Dysgonamonadaceae bacterium]
MLIRKEYLDENENCLMGIWKITETRDELLNMLSIENQIKARKYLANIKSIKRTLEWLSIRVILQLLTNDNKTVKHTPEGQPFLSDNSFQISISHSNDYAVVLLDKHRKVGVDIENYSDRILKIEERFMSQGEYINPNKRILHLILHWCAKETLFKLMNSTDIIFKEHLHIHPFHIRDRGIITANESFTDAKTVFDIYYEVEEDYVLTWGMK